MVSAHLPQPYLGQRTFPRSPVKLGVYTRAHTWQLPAAGLWQLEARLSLVAFACS